jgi:hypothetical protein
MKANVDTSSYSKPSQVIMAAMKKYGLLIADIGSDWYFQGDSDDGWTAPAKPGCNLLCELVTDFRNIQGSDFEAVYTGDPVNTGL